jgi:hypothetical protein
VLGVSQGKAKLVPLSRRLEWALLLVFSIFHYLWYYLFGFWVTKLKRPRCICTSTPPNDLVPWAYLQPPQVKWPRCDGLFLYPPKLLFLAIVATRT